MMRSEKESHVLRESPAYSVCGSHFIVQFLPDSKYVCENILALAPQNYFAFVLVGRVERAHLVVSSARIFYLYNYIYTYNKLDIYYIYDAPSS